SRILHRRSRTRTGAVGSRLQRGAGARLAVDVADAATDLVDRQGTSAAWCTTPDRLSCTNTARRRFFRFQVDSISNGSRRVEAKRPSSSMYSYFVRRAGKRATSDFPLFSPERTLVTTPSSRRT